MLTLDLIKDAIKTFEIPPNRKELSEHLNTTPEKLSKIVRSEGFILSDLMPIKRDQLINKRPTILNGLKEKREKTDWNCWFVGLVDGEGCFSIGLKAGKVYYGIAIEHKFSLHFHGREYPVLEEIKNTLSLKDNIYTWTDSGTKEPAVGLSCKNLVDLSTIIVPIFNTYPLHTEKRKSFDLWKESIELRLYPTKENLKRILEITRLINPRKNKRKKSFIFNEETQLFEKQES